MSLSFKQHTSRKFAQEFVNWFIKQDGADKFIVEYTKQEAEKT